ncbi:MAG: Hsp70 family protein [Actinomycetota bacterium]|nr:Hsp70 family protein [Actinomycetota bacterium]
MSYQLGVDLGTTYSAAAVAESGRVEIFQLGTSMASIPSVVLLRDDGTVLTGEAAQRRSLFESSRTAREFKRRLGDPIPYLLGGTPYGVEALTGHLMASIVDRVATERGEPPSVVVLAHPAAYGPYKLGFMEDAARLAGVGSVRFVPEPVAAAVYYSHTEGVTKGEMIAVYDFGGGTLDLAVVRKTSDGFEVVGTPEGMERFGGIDLDEAVFGHVDEALGGIVGHSDPDDPTTVAAVVALRTSCREAKEALSADTDVTIPVMLPNLHTEVRLTRGEFEDMIRPRLRETMSALDRTVRSAGVSYDDLSRVLLVGGASRIPLVSEMVRDTTGRPVAVDAHPKHAVALGAALVPEAADTPPMPTVPPESQARVVESPTVQSEVAIAGVAPVVGARTESKPTADSEERDPETAAISVVSGKPEAIEEDRPSEEPSSHPVTAGADISRSRRLYTALGVIAALVVTVGGFLWLRGGGEQSGEATPAPTADPAPTAELTPAADPGLTAASAGRVATVYLIGYRSMEHDDEWGDWSIGDNQAPDNIASDYMPALGPYSSADPGVQNEHFEMLRQSSIGVVSVLWGGRGSLDDGVMPEVLDEAERHGLSVTFVVQAPEDGAVETLLDDIEYLRAAYADHPAVFRPSEPSLWTADARMLVSVAGVEALERNDALDLGPWRDTLDAIHHIDGGVIVLAISSDPGWVDDGHFDGLQNGPIDGVEPFSYEWADDLPGGAWFVPVVSPGMSSDWDERSDRSIPRDGGARYEGLWGAAISAPRSPNLVMILSFNGWQRGTQIEPTAPEALHPDGSPYLDYAPVHPEGYLDLTRAAVERWAES